MNVFNITWITITTPVACRQQNTRRKTKTTSTTHTLPPTTAKATAKNISLYNLTLKLKLEFLFYICTNTNNWNRDRDKREAKMKSEIRCRGGNKRQQQHNLQYIGIHLNFATLWHKFKRHAFKNENEINNCSGNSIKTLASTTATYRQRKRNTNKKERTKKHHYKSSLTANPWHFHFFVAVWCSSSDYSVIHSIQLSFIIIINS